jgi:hypothetical protein
MQDHHDNLWYKLSPMKRAERRHLRTDIEGHMQVMQRCLRQRKNTQTAEKR